MELAIVTSTDPDNPTIGDLKLVGGRLTFTRVLAEEVAQRLLVRLNFWQREWFLNLNAGTPYLSAVFEKGVPDSTIRAVFTAIVATTKGVRAVDSLTFSRDNTQRSLDLQFVCRLEDGTTFRSTTYGPFVVSVAA